jgi:hypothetical protein
MDFVGSSSKKTLALPEQVKQDIARKDTFQIWGKVKHSFKDRSHKTSGLVAHTKGLFAQYSAVRH